MDTVKVDDLYRKGMLEFLNNNWERSIELLSEAAELDPARKLTFVSRGSAFLKQDRVEEALADFSHAIELDPEYARAFHLRGLAEEKAGDDTAALNDFNRAIEIDPEYGVAYHSRATLHTKMGHEDQAMEDIAMVQHLTNRNLETFANESNVWRSQQMRVEAAMESESGR
jgi:tetratricopeptide (TPR) repeat protein